MTPSRRQEQTSPALQTGSVTAEGYGVAVPVLVEETYHDSTGHPETYGVRATQGPHEGILVYLDAHLVTLN